MPVPVYVPAFAGTHCAYPGRDGNAELNCVAGYVPGWSLILVLTTPGVEYEFGIVWVPVYEFWQTRVCMYFNGSHSHTWVGYGYGLPVNFTRTCSFCANHVFIQPV